MDITRRLVLGGTAAGALLPVRLARAQSRPTIKIGVLGDMSGVYRDISGPLAVASVQQAIEEFNPGAHGFDIEVVQADHQNKADVGSAIVRQWIDQNGVDMVVDCPNSAVALAVAGICHEKDRVFIDSGAGTAVLTGKQCAPTTVHFTYDTWMLAHSTGAAVVKQGGTSWFFVTADYAFGQALESDTTAFVKAAGGTVLGDVRAPLSTTDFSSYLTQAQASGAKVIALANAGQNTSNCVKQAHEFGITQSGAMLAGLLVFISDVHAIGLDIAKGLVLTATFYWDLNDRTRAFSKRIQPKIGDARLSMSQAGDYAGTLHYLRAVAGMGAAAAKKSGAATVAKMKSLPTDDDAFGAGSIREDGRALHPAYLFQVKSPSESKEPWDYYKLLATTPADQAFRPLKDGACPFIKA